MDSENYTEQKNEEASGCLFLAVGALIFVALCTLGGILYLFT
jgi:hypothetical protein